MENGKSVYYYDGCRTWTLAVFQVQMVHIIYLLGCRNVLMCPLCQPGFIFGFCNQCDGAKSTSWVRMLLLEGWVTHLHVFMEKQPNTHLSIFAWCSPLSVLTVYKKKKKDLYLVFQGHSSIRKPKLKAAFSQLFLLWSKLKLNK